MEVSPCITQAERSIWVWVFVLLGGLAAGQGPHPRLLFTASDVPALQVKVNATGSPAAGSYAAMVSSASLVTSSNQFAYAVYRGLRRMTETAFRYQMTGYGPYGDSAKTALLQYCAWLNPTSDKAYLSSTYPCALALTFDMVHDRLSTSERATVVATLETWVTTMLNGTNGWTNYASFAHAVDNYSMAWCTGIALTLMAIEGESSYPNLQGLITDNLDKLEAGWNDAISPDGSVDEAYGYANYGNLYSINAGVAALNCGYGDRLANKNILRTPRWLGASFSGDTFTWIGDSSPGHKGNRIDPIAYYGLTRPETADPAALWSLNRVFAVEPVSGSTPSHAFSPFLHHVLYYPHTLIEQRPEVLSGFFRDNLNQGTAWSNKLQAYPEIGDGGHAFLHNATDPSWVDMSAFYMIRDEWMTHNHEDDGHLALAAGGVWQYLDIGYAESGSWSGAQTTDHNIVLVQGEPGFGGNANNYYSPPGTNGRFLGRKLDAMMSPWMDYVRGDHANMWMMELAQRSVILMKDANLPYMILVDRVRKDGAQHTYEEVFHAAGPANGAGTASNPMTITAGGQTLRASWLSPANVNVAAGTQASNSGITYWRNRVMATGSEVTFLSVHGVTVPMSTMPLGSPLANTAGGVLDFGAHTDTILIREGAGAIGDQATNTSADAWFAWVREQSGQLDSWAVGEGMSFSRGGTTVLASNKVVTAVARDGRIFIQTVDGSGTAGLALTMATPFVVTELVIDGQAEAFTQLGGETTFGGGSGGSLPSPSDDDRAYTFTHSYLWDLVPSANACFDHGVVSSTGGIAGLAFKGGAALGGRPLSLGMHLRFLAGASAGDAGLELKSVTADGAVLTVQAEPASTTTYRLRIALGGASLGNVLVPYGLGGTWGRFYLRIDPATRSLQIRDAVDAPLATFTAFMLSQTFQVTAHVSEFAEVDDLTLFDSGEDGLTPQGVAFYCNQYGYGGAVLRAPTLLSMQDFHSVYNGAFINRAFETSWFVNGFLEEFLLNAHVPFGTVAPWTFEEAGLEFGVEAISILSGDTTGFWFKTASGRELFGAVSF